MHAPKKLNILIYFSALYERRVLLNGKGDIKMRTEAFKLAFRTKLNNWWNTHASKILAQINKDNGTKENTSGNDDDNLQ